MQPTTQQSENSNKALTAQFDEDGFMLNPSHWRPDISQAIAESCDLDPLNHHHWKVIFFLRTYYEEFEVLPALHRVYRVCGLKKQAVKSLFGGCKNAWRIAGLPNPGPEALTYIA